MRVKGWSRFQHFNDRRPLWIKLYRDLLDNLAWCELDGDTAKCLVMLWLVASENHGELPPMKELSFRLRIAESKLKQHVTKLSLWLEEVDIEPVSNGYQLDDLEKRREEKRREDIMSILEDLNTKGNFKFKVCESTKALILARMDEGFKVEDFSTVHYNMIEAWGEDPKMSIYLRPSTLYRASKFQGYLNWNRQPKLRII